MTDAFALLKSLPPHPSHSPAVAQRANGWSDHPHWCVFLEAYQPDTMFRSQWLWLPPRIVTDPAADERLLHDTGASKAEYGFLKRRISTSNTRPKWERYLYQDVTQAIDVLLSALFNYRNMSWELRTPVVCPMRAEDYFGLWAPANRVKQATGFETPYTTLRWIENIYKATFDCKLSGKAKP